ncbi:MAG: glycosyltransferase [Fusobacteriaceae bacterium]
MNKKIIFRSGSLRMGGLERVLIEVLQTIDKKKYEIILFIEDDSGSDNIFLKDIPEEIKIYFLKPEKLMRKTEFYRKNKNNLYYKLMYNIYMGLEKKIVLKNTKKYIKKIGKIDIFIDFDWGAVKYIEKLKLKKTFVWIHNSVPKLLKKDSKIKRFGKNIEKYNKVIAICDDMKNELENIYPNIRGKVVKIYNPFNFERIEELSEDKSQLTTHEKEMLNEEYIVAVSRLDTVQKDYYTLLKAFEILKNNKINKKLYIVGDGPNEKDIKKIVQELKLEEIVKFIGLTKNPYVWIKNSIFFIHSSKYEGLPTVLIEAMICNKIVISSDCPTGPREILDNGKCGILYPVGDYKSLASEVINILNDGVKINKLLIKLKERRKEFNRVKVIKEYEKLIDGK